MTTACVLGRHEWPPHVGDPVGPEVFDGRRCYCGSQVLRLVQCDTCGATQLEMGP